MDAEDRELFDRSLAHATATHSGPALDAALEDLGWADALAEDPATAVGLLFEHQGRANATSSALDRVLADALGRGRTGRPACTRRPPAAGRRPDRLQGLGTAGPGFGDGGGGRRDDDATATHPGRRWTRTTSTLRPVAGLDPALGLVEVTGARPRPRTVTPLDPATWDAAMAAGQRALAHELVGASRSMLALARDHAVDRIQFGVPIASFQAVRHRLAESLVAVEAADAAVGAAWADGTPLAAAMAKAVAGHSARTVARHAQQVLAGVGFTTEHPFHHHLRRTFVLDGLLGSSRSLTIALGEQLLATRQLPPLLPL